MYRFLQDSTRPILSVNETTHLSHDYLRHQYPIIWAHEDTTPFPLHKLRRNFLQIAKIIPSASTKVKENIMRTTTFSYDSSALRASNSPAHAKLSGI